MRISTTQIYRTSIDAILDQQAHNAKTQLQIATGKRVLKPSDDPAASAKILELRNALSVNDQYLVNSDAARARLNREENALVGVENILLRVRELAVQGNNDSQSSVSRGDIAAEINERIEELIGIANTRDANGEYLFSGFQRLTQPFSRNATGTVTYAGDQGQRFLQIGPSRQLADGDSGSEVFLEVKNGNGTFTVTDNTSNTGSGIIDPGSVVDISAYDNDTYTLILADSTTVAGGAIGITDANANDTLQYELRVNGTLVYTANEGDSRTQAQLAADIAAQSGTTGVTAYVDGGTLYLANTTPSGQAITITETLTGASEEADTVTGYFGSVLTGVSSPSATVTFDADASGYVVLDSSSNIETSGTYQEVAFITFNGIQTSVSGTPDNGDRFTLAPSVNQSLFTTLQNLVTTLESAAVIEADRAAFHNAMNRFLVDIDQTQTHNLEVRGRVGSRMNSVDDQENMNEVSTLQIRETLSRVEDLDFADAVSRFNLQLIALQAAQQTFIRLQGLTLFNFLR